MGEAIQFEIDLEVDDATGPDGERAAGYGWSLRPDTLRLLKEIEENTRAAEQTSGQLIVG